MYLDPDWLTKGQGGTNNIFYLDSGTRNLISSSSRVTHIQDSSLFALDFQLL